MTELPELAERMTFIADSIDEGSYMHPLGANEDCLVAAAVVADYVATKNRELDTQVELAKLRAGFAWTAKREEIMRAEYWMELEERLRTIGRDLRDKQD